MPCWTQLRVCGSELIRHLFNPVISKHHETINHPDRRGDVVVLFTPKLLLTDTSFLAIL